MYGHSSVERLNYWTPISSASTFIPLPSQSVRSEADGLPARVGLSVLSLLLALYAVAGWLAVSGAVLTATNTLRRNLI
jgi:hypothetical protein